LLAEFERDDGSADPLMKEGSMLRKSFTAVALIAVIACCAGGYASLNAAQAADQAPPMGGGYANVIAIPVDPADAADGKAIVGALIKPEGAGPFPTVVYISGCAGLDLLADKALQKALIGHLTTKGFATFVVDLYTPRKEANGACENGIAPMARGARDIHAVLNVLVAMPEVDANRVFLQGYSLGASSALLASDSRAMAAHKAKVAGVVAFYPYCKLGTDFSVPTLVLIGDKDDLTPARYCQEITGKPNLEVVVYPGVTHAFAMPGQNIKFMGSQLTYDEKATQDAEQRVDAFMAAHMK
jgi:dienelactone hydrolase